MNIFVTEPCPVKSAQGLCDKHIPKMTLESAQMLSTAWRVHGEQYAEDQGLYKQAYLNHPCTIWARAEFENYMWLFKHFVSLCQEYTHRFNKIHASARLIPALSRPPTILQFESDIPDAPKTFALAMPDEYKEENVYSSYRNYLINEKSHFAKWERDPSRKPTWWIN
jgi:hypothetical protein